MAEKQWAKRASVAEIVLPRAIIAIGLMPVLTQLSGCPAVITARITNQSSEPVAWLVHSSYSTEISPGRRQNVPWRHDCVVIDSVDGPMRFSSGPLPDGSYRTRMFSVRLNVRLTPDGELIVENRDGEDASLSRIADCEL